jgi:tetratricopeptide (TPR) repeat protein
MSRHPFPTAKQQNRKLNQDPSQTISGILTKAFQHHQAGQLNEAARMYREILAIDARHADSLHLLGMIEYQYGHREIAAELVRKAIASNAKQAQYHSNLGTILESQGKLAEAVACYKRALALKPEFVEACYNLGNAHRALGELDEAAAYYQRALALKPDFAEAHSNLGNILRGQGKLDEAVERHLRALRLKPGFPEGYYNLGSALQAQDKLDEALVCFERAVTLKPDFVEAHHNLGNVFYALGRLDEAQEQYRKVLDHQPDHIEARFSESLARLCNGDFASGWRNYEWRWKSKAHASIPRAFPQPLWKGEKLASGNLLIWGEQGVGDEIMFAGLIPDVIRSGNRCILDCDARLKPLFARSFPPVEVVSSCKPDHDPKRDFAAHLPSGSLPGLFRTSEASFAATTSPYLVADPAERERFRKAYAADGRRLVGIAWYTNNRETGPSRSIDLSSFAPLFARPDIHWISLQYGDRDKLENQAAEASAPIYIDRSVDQLSNVDVFAAQIAALDMVVTIDNSTAHLAGALGIPTYLLLPFSPDWRWMMKRESTPWYPTLRLFRQPKRGDWQSVIQTVQKAF